LTAGLQSLRQTRDSAPMPRPTVITLAALLLAQLAASHAGESHQLLQDAGFSKGFGAAFIYGTEFSGGRRPPVGAVTAYRDIAPHQVHLIPDGPVSKVGVRSHPWDFQEGYHENYTNKGGDIMRELHMHRLVVNHVVEVNTSAKLQFAQFNNDELATGDALWNTRLVKRVTTDRQGTVRLYYNSQNEIRNAAISHTAKWARDTWPHFLLNQRFVQPIPLADHARLDFTVSFQVDQMKQRSNWPNTVPDGARSAMNLNFMFYLRSLRTPDQRLFVGMMLFTSREKHYEPFLGVEQHGMVFYRDCITSDQPRPALGEKRTVQRELKTMIAEALRQAQTKKPALSTDLNDYVLANFSIGFEGMGHWETECEISALNLSSSKTPTGKKP
jgi:hypothetical protein